MNIKNIIDIVERQFGRQPEAYLIQLINDAMDEISSKKQNYLVAATETLTAKKRYYELADRMIDVIRVEILDTNNRYVKIPKLIDSHNLRKDDTDASSGGGDADNSTVN
jgi:hypothetical protein